MAELSNKQLQQIVDQLGKLDKKVSTVQSIAKSNASALTINSLTNEAIVCGICLALGLGSIAYRQVINFYDTVADKVPFLEGTQDKAEQFTPDNTPLKKGDKVAGFVVTSNYKDPSRSRPDYEHNGVDIGAPEGTPYYAPGSVVVQCFWDDGGGGYVAQFPFNGHTWQLLHLKDDSCVAGAHKAGSKIGEMGNTGRSTGPHLHLQLRKADRSFVEPTKGHVLAVLTQQSHPSLGSVTELVMELEGFHATPYWDYAQWTIGYGTKAKNKNETVDKAETRTRLEADLAKRSEVVSRLVKVPLTPNQRAALISFTFNIGDGAFEKSRLLKKLNAGDYAGAANQLDVWVHAGGKRLPGLVNRRAKEKALFLRK